MADFLDINIPKESLSQLNEGPVQANKEKEARSRKPLRQTDINQRAKALYDTLSKFIHI